MVGSDPRQLAPRAPVDRASGTKLRRSVAPAPAVAAGDDHQTLILVLLPVLLLAGALWLGQSARLSSRLAAIVEARLESTLPGSGPASRPVPSQALWPELRMPGAAPPVRLPEIDVAALPALALPVAPPAVPPLEVTVAMLPAIALPGRAPAIELPRPEAQLPAVVYRPAAPAWPELAPGDLPALALATRSPAIEVEPPLAGRPSLSLSTAAPAIDPLTLLALTTPEPRLPPPPEALADVAAAGLSASPGPSLQTAACLPPHRSAAASVPLAGDGDFGDRLAAVARQQLDDLVIYSARYQRIRFPQGDVPPLYGACTDVIVRAYRALGVDLQQLVQLSRVGSGDPNIDHRRTETLRYFFARAGRSLPVTDIAENFRPGDIVTYHRPFSRVSRAHIAIVSDVIAPSGRPMILHNRGWGAQLEDALFADKITGHYRYHPTPAEGVVDAMQPKRDPAAGRAAVAPRRRIAG